jgi:CBS domain-containing protein
MDVELIEIREFLAEHPPFDHLPAEVLDTLPKRLAVRYLRRGTPFPPVDLAAAALPILRKGAIEFRDEQGELLEKLGEGDVYPAACLGADETLPVSGKVVEDSLLYLLPCAELEALRARFNDFNRHFEQSLRVRLEQAIAQQQQGHNGLSSLMHLEATALLQRSPVTISPDKSIREAAGKMTAERVSCLPVVDGEKLLGIVTDRDLRQRCIAAGVDTGEKVSTIMSDKLLTITGDTPAFEALLEMTRHHIHHLPLLDTEGRLHGIISASDILHHHSVNTVALAGAVRRCRDVDAVVEACRQLPELQAQLIASGLSAEQLTRALSTVVDGIGRRLLELAEERLGPPPVPYAWLVCGSQARREQTSVSDQDSALLIADTMQPEHDAWFAELARFVSDALARCGFAYCPGEVMASNAKWRQPLSAWRRYFAGWINSPEPKALMHASIFFDIRVLYGDESLYQPLHEEMLQQCRNSTIFHAAMASNALHHRPPLGFFRQFVLVHDGKHDDTLDLKHNGIIPIVDLARVFALSAGLPQLNTRARLKAAEQAGALSHDGAEDLLHALEFIAALRARHQTQQHIDGEEMDNFVRPDSLSHLERSQLKDAFAVISSMQETLAHRYQTGRFA